MTLYLRLFRIVLCALFKKKISFHDSSEIHFRIWPIMDCEFVSLNASQYSSFLELARMDWITRLGMTPTLLFKTGTWGILNSQMIYYRFPFKVGERLTVRTRAIFWDDRFYHFEHKVLSGEKLKALAYVKVCLRNKEGILKTQDLGKMLGLDSTALPKPLEVSAYNEIQDKAFSPKF